MASINQQNPYRRIEEQTRAQLSEAKETRDQKVDALSKEYDALNTPSSPKSRFQQKLHERASEIKEALDNTKDQGHAATMEAVKRFGIVSDKLVEFLQRTDPSEKLEYIKMIIHPRGIYLNECAFGGSHVRSAQEKMEKLDSPIIGSAQREKLQHAAYLDIQKAKQQQNQLVNDIITSNEAVPSYISFMNKISPGLLQDIAREEMKGSPNSQATNLVKSAYEAHSEYTKETQNLRQAESHAKQAEYSRSIHESTLLDSSRSTPEQRRVAKTALGLDAESLPPTQSSTSVYQPSAGEFSKVFLETLFQNRAPSTAGLEVHLQMYLTMSGKEQNGEPVSSNKSPQEAARLGLALLCHDLDKYYGCPDARTGLISAAISKGIISSARDLETIPVMEQSFNQAADLNLPKTHNTEPQSAHTFVSSSSSSNSHTTSHVTEASEASKSADAHVNLSGKVETWKNSLEKFCNNQGIDATRLTQEDIQKASERLISKGYGKNELNQLLAATDKNSTLGKVLSNTIDHLLLQETTKQYQEYIANGGTHEKAISFFLNNPKSQHIDTLLKLANDSNNTLIKGFLSDAKESKNNATLLAANY